MVRLLRSKIIAWFTLLLVIIIIVVTFSFRPGWWAFIDEFFAFMAVFSHLASLYLRGMNYYVGKKLDTFAAFFGVLMILAFIGEYVAYLVLFS